MPNFDDVLLNKQNWCKSKYMTFEYGTSTQNSSVIDESKSNFYPWKDIVGKKVSKLRSIAELRAFYGCLHSLLYRWKAAVEFGPMVLENFLDV